MKIGIITDIHSNIQALNAVLDEFDKLNVDKIICSGDIIGIGINPDETVKKLMSLKDKLIIVSGNHEQYLINGLPEKVHDNKRSMSNNEIENHKWNQNLLSKESKEFINNLEISKTMELAGKKFYIIHYPINNDGSYKVHIKNPSINDIKEIFKDIDADVYLYGHIHNYNVLKDDDKWYINTGSLGCPKDTNIAKAGIIEINNGEIKFIPINIEYNVSEIIEKINELKFPFYEKILKIFYGRNNKESE